MPPPLPAYPRCPPPLTGFEMESAAEPMETETPEEVLNLPEGFQEGVDEVVDLDGM